MKNALIIFTRNPELGKCKTRLAKTIGDTAALNVYNYLLQHTANVAKQVNAHRFVFYSEAIQTNDIWNENHFIKQLQQGDDLGERMQNAFEYLFKNQYKNVIIIGSDLLDLTPNIISEAYEKLNTHDAVIGPAEDGGYYLLGLKAMNTTIFKNKEWGTNTVRANTLTNLQHSNVYLLPMLNDIDTFNDMKHYNELKHLYNHA